jgi:hypothetical protein
LEAKRGRFVMLGTFGIRLLVLHARLGGGSRDVFTCRIITREVNYSPAPMSVAPSAVGRVPSPLPLILLMFAPVFRRRLHSSRAQT